MKKQEQIDIVRKMIADGVVTQEQAAKYFPELTESEDEKIRKNIITTIHLYYGEPLDDEAKEMIAWLEKQGEHANFRNKIKIGDKVTRNKDGVLVNLSQLNRVAKKDEKQGEKNMGISEATKQELENNLHKALEKETPESWNEFLDEQGEHKPWSEEDEDIKESIITGLEMLKGGVSDQSLIALYNKKTDWLKSLKDRYTWKPTEEQIEALVSAIDVMIDNRGAGDKNTILLSGLYHELKKLREE